MRVLPALLVLLATPLTSPAADADRFLHASKLLQEGRWAEAEAELADVAAARPGDPDVQALLGIARYELGRLDEAVATLGAALRGGTRYEARTLYMLGAALGRQGRDDEAARMFARLLAEHPDTPEAARVREDAAPARASRPRSWHTVVRATVQHDDNPARGTPVDDLAPPVPSADWVGQLTAFASRTLAASRVTLSGSAFRIDYRDADPFDYTAAWTRAEGVLRRTPRTRIAPAYAFRYSWVEDAAFEIRHAAELRITRALGARWSATLFTTWAWKVHPGGEFDDLDGDEAGGTISFQRRGGAGARVPSLRLALDVLGTDARDDPLAHVDGGVSTTTTVALPARLGLDLSADVTRREYRVTDPRFGDRRQDTRWRGSAFVTAPVGAGFGLRLGATYTDNRSTIRRYDTTQLVAGTTITFTR